MRASAKSCGRIPRMTGPDWTSPGRRSAASGIRKPANSTVVAHDLGLDEVHRRRADEGRDEEVERLAIEGLRRVDLLHGAVAHHRHAGAERHRLDLVVGHVDGRDPEPVVETRQLGAHVDSKLRVQVRERLVHQERLRLAHDRAPHRDTLALAARERARPALEQLLQPEQACDLDDAALDLGLRRVPHLQPVAEVLRDRHVRIERVVLEHHRDVAVAGREPGDLALADPDVALGHLLEAGNHPQQRRLPAAGGADEDHELAAPDCQIDAVDGTDVPVVDLSDLLEPDLGHVRAPDVDA